MKETLYYVLKYEDKYYAPYMSRKSFNPFSKVENMLTENRKLAVRFGDKEMADDIREREVAIRNYSGYDSLLEPPSDTAPSTFDPTKCRIVKVVRKVKRIH
jgi:hypothetical protein